MKTHAQNRNHAIVARVSSTWANLNLRGIFGLLAALAALTSVIGLSGCAGVTSAAPAPAVTPPVGLSSVILTPSATTVSFGSVLVNSSASSWVMLTNSGTASATISSASVSGTGFGISGLSAGQVIAAGQSMSFNAQFAPTAAGTPSGAITIVSNASTSTLTITLSGTGTSQPQAQIGINPTSESFGNVAVGASNPQTITLTNTGNQALTISAASASGTGYTMSGLTAGQVINAGLSANFTATFTPTAGGSAVGSISITSNAPSSPSVIVLTGTGTQALIAANPTSANLGSAVDGTSNSQSIVLSNAGNTTLTFSGVSTTGTGYSVTGLSTSTTIAAGGNVTFHALFSPTGGASGTVNGSIVLTTNGSPSQLTIPLTGVAVAASTQLGANPTSLSFGSVTDGSSSQMTSTLTNTGNSNITISSVTVTGAGFSASGVASGLVLQPTQTATLTVTFAPTTAGAVSGAGVTIGSNAGSLGITLSGTGTAVVQHSVSLTWGASGSSGVIGYYVYESTTSGSGYTKLNPSAPVSNLQYTDSAVTAGQTYYYVVTAVNSGGTESADSNMATALIP